MLNIETIIKLMVDVASLLSRTYHVNKITDGNDQPWHMTMENLLFIKLLNMLTWIRDKPSWMVVGRDQGENVQHSKDEKRRPIDKRNSLQKKRMEPPSGHVSVG